MPMRPGTTVSKMRSPYVATISGERRIKVPPGVPLGIRKRSVALPARKQVVQLGEVFRGSAALLNCQNVGAEGDAGKKADLGPMAPKRGSVADVRTEKRGGVPRAHNERDAEEVGDAPCRWRRRSMRKGGAWLRL